ncbi:CG-1 domain-containing protein [Pelagophyceae sp. CCMP2097]|nr:CG-1 domain-containing protein [Pelagophyceae sp. CCMP2097]
MLGTRQQYSEAAQWRWLRPEEVFDVLTHHQILGCTVSLAPPDRPPSGAIFLYDRRRTKRFRRDGHSWALRKSAGRIREDHVKLRVNGQHRVSAAHAHGADAQTFHRRTYLLLPADATEAADDAAALALVHYRECSAGDGTEGAEGRRGLEIDAHDRAERDLLAALDAAEGPQLDGSQLLEGSDDDLLLGTTFDDLAATLPQAGADAFAPRTFTHGALGALLPRDRQAAQVSDSAVDAMSGASHRGIDLRQTQRTRVVQYAPRTVFAHDDETTVLFVFDAALVATDPAAEDGAPPAFEQSMAPRCEVVGGAAFDLVVWTGQTLILNSFTASLTLPKIGCGSALLRLKRPDGAVIESDCVMKITCVAAAMPPPAPPPPPCEAASEDSQRGSSSEDQRRRAYFDDAREGDVADMPKAELDEAVEKLMLRVVVQMSRLAATDAELADELDAPDRNGLGLLHYCALYNLASLIDDLLIKGAAADGRPDCSKTPMHVAAAAGHLAAVQQLARGGADARALDSRGRTPRQAARDQGHSNVAQWLAAAEAARHADASPLSPPSKRRSVQDDESTEPESASPPMRTISTFQSEAFQTDAFQAASPASREPHELTYTALLHTAFSSLSLHEKCALKIVASRTATSSRASDNSLASEVAAFCGDAAMTEASSGLDGAARFECDTPVDAADAESRAAVIESPLSVISDSDGESLDVAMSLMDAYEISQLEDEATVITANVKAWIVRRNFIKVKEAARTLEARWIERRVKHQTKKRLRDKQLDTVPEHEAAPAKPPGHAPPGGYASATRAANVKMLQAASRGMLARRQLRSLKEQMLALLVASRNFRETPAGPS